MQEVRVESDAKARRYQPCVSSSDLERLPLLLQSERERARARVSLELVSVQCG
jgi:hypothetical protein